MPAASSPMHAVPEGKGHLSWERCLLVCAGLPMLSGDCRQTILPGAVLFRSSWQSRRVLPSPLSASRLSLLSLQLSPLPSLQFL